MRSYSRASRAHRLAALRAQVFVVMTTYHKAHDRLVTAAEWLRDTPHIVYTDQPLSQKHREQLSGVDVRVQRHMDVHVGKRGVGWQAHRTSDARQNLVVADSNTTAASRASRWTIFIDDDTMVILPRLRAMLSRADHRVPLLLGSAIDVYGIDLNSSGHGEPVAPNRTRLLPGASCAMRREHEPCYLRWMPKSRCTEPGNSLVAPSSTICLPGIADGRPTDGCRECFCPVRPAGNGLYQLDFASGRASLTPALTFPYGGYGVIMSRGLLDLMRADAWYECARKLVCGPSDFRIATCVQNIAGIGVSGIEYRLPWPPVGFFNESDEMQDEVLRSSVVEDWPWAVHKIYSPRIERRLQAAYQRARRRRRWSFVGGMPFRRK